MDPARPPDESWLEKTDGTTYWLSTRCSIGRQITNDLVLDDSSVSRHHAVLVGQPGKFLLTDLRSSNGSQVNGSPVTRPTALKDGDLLRFGDVILRFRSNTSTIPDVLDLTAGSTRRVADVRERKCWLLLTDIVGYSGIIAEKGSRDALQAFHAWIAGMRPLIEKQGGCINSYVGDAIFAWWSADNSTPEVVRSAVHGLERWRTKSPVGYRMVLHYGAVLASRSERGEELSGQEVNFVFRAEKIAKKFQTLFLLSHSAVESLGLSKETQFLGNSTVDGIEGDFPFFGLTEKHFPE